MLVCAGLNYLCGVMGVREIKSITIVTQQGACSYEIGDKVNGLEIERIKDVSVEYENALHVGYHCLSRIGNSTSNAVVEIWNAPVVVEYYEPEVTP